MPDTIVILTQHPSWFNGCNFLFLTICFPSSPIIHTHHSFSPPVKVDPDQTWNMAPRKLSPYSTPHALFLHGLRVQRNFPGSCFLNSCFKQDFHSYLFVFKVPILFLKLLPDKVDFYSSILF